MSYYPPPPPPPPPSSFVATSGPPTTPHTTPQPPATPRTLHSSDPEVLTPPEGPYPTNSTATDGDNGDDTKPGATSNSPLPRPGSHTPQSSSLRADWLASRAPEYYHASLSSPSLLLQQQQQQQQQQRPPPPPPPPQEPGWYREWEGREREKEEKKRRVCGLRPGVFWIVILLLVLLLGGAIGGGVGGGLAASGSREAAAEEESSTASTTTNASSSTTILSGSASPSASNQDSIDCPSRTGQYYTTTNGSLTFLQLCGINICPETCDIVSASKQRLDTFEECMDACATYNKQIGTQKCVAVAWDYQQVRQSFDKLCWLKLSQAPLVSDDPQDGLTIGAVVVQS